MYTLTDVTKTYSQSKRQVVALNDVTLDIPDGQLVAIQGPTGGGKSTLLQMLGALDRPTSGSVQLGADSLSKQHDGRLAKIRAKEIGFVFQGFNLIPTLTAQENVETALAPLKVSAADRRRRAAEALASVGLADRGAHLPSELSGGQQQRVAVARALASRPEIVFADEPTGNLDSRAGAEILSFMRQAVRELGQTIVMVTHDPVAASYADRVLYLADGRIVDEMFKPTAESVLDRMKDFDARGRTS